MDDPAAVLDMTLVAEIKSIDNALFDELANRFESDGRAHIAAIERAFAAGDREGLNRRAHAMNGACGAMGAMRVASICRRLQQCSLDEAADHIHALSAEFDAAHQEVQSARDA